MSIQGQVGMPSERLRDAAVDGKYLEFRSVMAIRSHRPDNRRPGAPQAKTKLVGVRGGSRGGRTAWRAIGVLDSPHQTPAVPCQVGQGAAVNSG